MTSETQVLPPTERRSIVKLVVIGLAVLLIGCAKKSPEPPLPKCLRSHVEVVRVQGPPTYIKVGEVWIPVTPSPRDEVRTVCDEYEQPKAVTQ